ncbi:polysaccharide lyase family 8 super-sandwich domain-containing protein [Kiritimatiellaeota bacterium B1221]|nr:polysaccharide lyase family 8 super-sandwich domain-containing protein [Kiritimatiellaeota bacterium B1221]
MQFPTFLFFVVLSSFCCWSTPLQATEIETLRLRIHNDFVAKTDKSEALNFLDRQQEDGSWADINYNDRDASYWTPILHLRRIRAIATAYYTPGHALENDADAFAAVESGLSYWLNHNNIYSSNWWHQEVNTPQQLGAILIVAYNDLSAEILSAGASELLRLKNLSSDAKWSSQNTVYTSFSRVYRAILVNDPTELALQFNRIKAQASYKTGLGRTGVTNNNTKEGVRIDYSFYQHGPALYNGFYGAHYVTDMSFWMAMSEGLSFAFIDAEKEVIQDYVLEGHRWTNRFGTLDPNITNRKISHDNYDYVTLRYHEPIVYGLEYLRDIDLPREMEIEAFYQHMVNDAEPVIQGNRSFWKTDFMVQAGSGYQVSTKLWSYHNEGTEYLNGDGRQGQFLSLGGTFLLREGDEYLEIFPMWDWGRIPGTTTLHRNPANPPNGALGSQKFAGGISNGTEGAMTYDHSYDSVQAQKSWFYFADCYVMLGAGVSGSSSSLDVNTTVEQIFLDGDITVSQNGSVSVLPGGDQAPTGLEWVYHDQVGYLFPAGGNIHVAGKAQSGSWYEINDSLPATTLTEEIFSIWFDHGRQPSSDSYACVVVPSVGRAAFDHFRTSEPIEILSNTSQIQAVRHRVRQLTQISFFEAGTLNTIDGLSVTVSAPCLVMIDESQSPALITVADPTQERAQVALEVVTGADELRSLNYIFPTGDEAGKSTQTEGFIPEPEVEGLGGTVVGWSNQSENGAAAYLTDGITDDDDKRWASNDSWGNEWVEIDLGANVILEEIRVFFYSGRSYQYTVASKPEGGTYSQIVDRSLNAETRMTIDAFTPVFARYIKISVSGAGNYGGSWTSLYEVQSFGERPSAYENWRYTREWISTPEDQRDADDDPEGDGVRNFTEFALGGNPEVSDAGTGLAYAFTHEADGSVLFRITYHKETPLLFYDLYHGTVLGEWTKGSGPESYDEEREMFWQSWQTDPGDEMGFVRLKISE